jgi:hypothetical protein
MSIYSQLVELKNQLGKIALRSPKTKEEIAVRNKYGRVMSILMKRYEYNMDNTLNEYRRQDQIDEIATIRRF